jgi:hypothetical protein
MVCSLTNPHMLPQLKFNLVETQKLFSLIQYCRGRVEMLEFWWHHASSKRNDPV